MVKNLYPSALICIAACTCSCSEMRSDAPLTRLGEAVLSPETTSSSRNLALTFERPSGDKIEISIRYQKPGEPPVYSDYGVISELVLKEGAYVCKLSYGVPSEPSIFMAEDFFPNNISLKSRKPGNYTLMIPWGARSTQGFFIFEEGKLVSKFTQPHPADHR